MNITPLNPDNQAAALAFLRRSPYRNALPLSNATQLRARSDVVVAEVGGRVTGVASTYRDLPRPNLTFAAGRDNELVRALIETLADRNPTLRGSDGLALLPRDRFEQLGRYAQIVAAEVEYQMVVEPETLRAPAGPAPRRLAEADLGAMAQLASAAGLTVWHERVLETGPAFGCFVGEQLVAMSATHFALPEVIEIGHIATHPDFRRQGYASACTAALTQAAFTLAPRVFLMVLDHNQSALATYKRLGFRTIESFYLTTFRL